MAAVGKYDSLLGTCAVLVSAGVFVLFRILDSNPRLFAVDAGPCQLPDSGLLMSLVPGILWLAAWVLAFLSVILGLASRKVSPVVKGVIALGLAFLNFANILKTDRSLFQEPNSIANLRNINTAQVTYISLSNGSYGSIHDLVRHDLLDSRFEEPETGSYDYDVVLTPEGYIASASPVGRLSGVEGCWEYFSGEDAVVRYSKDSRKAPPGLAGKPLR